MRRAAVLASLVTCITVCITACQPAAAPTPAVEFSGRWTFWQDSAAVNVLLGVDNAFGTVHGSGTINGVPVLVTGSAGRSGVVLTIWPAADQCPCDAYTLVATSKDGGRTMAGEFHDAGLSPRRCLNMAAQFDRFPVTLTRQ